MKGLLEDLVAENYGVSILSSNSTKTISAFLEARSVSGISGIYSSGRIFRKERLIRRFLRENRLDKNEVIYVCDELRDVQACKKAGIPVVWVSWGFETLDVFGTDQPPLIAHTPSELLEIITIGNESSLILGQHR